MSRAALLSPRQLARKIEAGDTVVFDCRFELLHPERGRQAWLAGHVPGAVHADLDRDLAGPVTPSSGRHPLPRARAFAAFLARSGWEPGMTVVAYDGGNGAVASRLWWLMQYFGQPDAALLDGGLDAWQRAGLPLEQGETRPRRKPAVRLQGDRTMVLRSREVAARLRQGELRLLDARDPERFLGRLETIDPVAGHVPGARNRYFGANLGADGRFLGVADLRKAFAGLVPADGPRKVAHMCGSGVTACHNLFAMERAGLAGSRLYVGSWSEWIRDPSRPVATGPE